MAAFITRVELHSAGYEDYETLHAAMEAEGFSRTITSGDNITYHLPTAEYNRSGNLTRDQVLESAKRAVVTTGKKYTVLVTESDGRTWTGLEKVTRQASGYYR